MRASPSCATGAKGTCATLSLWPRGTSRPSMARRCSSPQSTHRMMHAIPTCSDATPCGSKAGAAHPVTAPFYGICRTCTAKHPAQLPHSAWLIAAVARLSVLIARRPRRPDDARLTRVARRSADSPLARAPRGRQGLPFLASISRDMYEQRPHRRWTTAQKRANGARSKRRRCGWVVARPLHHDSSRTYVDQDVTKA